MGKMILLLRILHCLFHNFSYPPRYVYNRFNQFFSSHFEIAAVIPTRYIENEFNRLRYLLLNGPTISGNPKSISTFGEKTVKGYVNIPLRLKMEFEMSSRSLGTERWRTRTLTILVNNDFLVWSSNYCPLFNNIHFFYTGCPKSHVRISFSIFSTNLFDNINLFLFEW